MRVIADLHIHSKYSRATSQKMNIDELTHFAQIKGLNILGTSDFTHPKWMSELKSSLIEAQDKNLYKPSSNPASPIYFMVTSEVCTIFEFEGKAKKIHHVILTPSLEVAEQISDRLSHYGDLTVDGRPILNMSASELVEEIIGVSDDNVVFPAHVWTPWFSLFGAFSGFDRIEDCYEDMTKHIFALETGLSCYDEKTEVLTNDGWKKFSDIHYSDKICTLNPKTDEIEFQNPIGIFAYRYKGKMYRLKTKRVDLLVTPNHRLLVSSCDFRNPKPFFLEEARFLFNKSKRFKKDGSWTGKNVKYFVLPAVKIKHGNRYYSGLRYKREKRLPIESWLRFFGFWTAAGWTTGGENGVYDVYLVSQNASLLSEMKQLLESFGYNVYQNGITIRVRDYQLFHYLKQFGKSSDKFIPSDIKSLSKEMLEILLEYYLKGDGHVYGRRKKGVSASTSSTRLRDDLQEIALKIGVSAYYKLERKKGTSITSSNPSFKGHTLKQDAWQVYFIRKNKPIILPSTIKKYNHVESWVDFDGLVFSVAVPNQVVYIRRNGIPLWCGNSDPPMNWRLSALDRYSLVSNSDAHSPWPWRIGREANVFELPEITYNNIVGAIREKDNDRFKQTIEVNPAYGKYHWTGHRACGVSMPPKEAIKLGNVCPVCKRRLTEGVEQRVEALADRPADFHPEGTIGYVHLLPLHEILSAALGAKSLSTSKVWAVFNSLISRFGSEFSVLLDAQRRELSEVTNPRIAESILRVREERVKVTPGYDGVYGKITIFEKEEQHVKENEEVVSRKQAGLEEFM